MPTPYSTKSVDLCRHTAFRVGCVSCSANDSRLELEVAFAQAKMSAEITKGLETVDTKKGMSRDEQQRFEVKKKRVLEQHAAWAERSQVLQMMLDRLEAKVEHICNHFEPDEIEDAFELDAISNEEGLQQIWRSGTAEKAETDFNSGFISFLPEDPARQAQFAGLDRTNIPATLNSLVTDGVGLQVFLKHEKNMDQRTPARALGDEPGPAVMSYGAALAMFGEPAGPGPEPQPSLEDQLAQCDIAEPKQPNPKTEHEMRLRDSFNPPTEPLLGEDEQWALFRSNKFMADAAILACQYAKLVGEQARARAEQLKDKKEHNETDDKKVQKNTQPNESSAADSSGSSSSTKDGWPPVDGLDWAGFTNWIHRCRAVDPKFGSKTIKSWNTTRLERREAIVAKLKTWTPPKGFNDGSANHPNPKTYFPQDVSLGALELKEMGLTTKNVVR